MTRILTIIALLFTTPAWAEDDDRYYLGDDPPSEFYSYDQGNLNSVGRLIKQEKMPNEMLLPNSAQAIRLLYSSHAGLPFSVSLCNRSHISSSMEHNWSKCIPVVGEKK